MRNDRCDGCRACKKVKKVKLPKSFVDPTVTEEQLREAMKTGIEKMKQRKAEENAAPKVQKGTCVVCKGTVTGEYKHEADRPFSQIPLGPGSRNCFRWKFRGYHCINCGLKYEFCPPAQGELSTGEKVGSDA